MPLIKDTKNHFGRQLAASNVSLAQYLNIMAICSILGMGLIWSDVRIHIKALTNLKIYQKIVPINLDGQLKTDQAGTFFCTCLFVFGGKK